MVSYRFSVLGPTFSPECDRSCMRSCSKEEIGKAQKCETLDDLKENGCLASCPCVYETIAKWMKCGKTLYLRCLHILARF